MPMRWMYWSVFCLIFMAYGFRFSKVFVLKQRILGKRYRYWSVCNSPRGKAVEMLKEWLNVQGCKWNDKINLNQEEGRVYTKQRIKTGETLISIPLDLVLDSSKISPQLTRIIEANELQTKDLGQLALVLLWERSQGKDSRFYSYIQSLPSSPTNIFSWNATEIHELCQSSTRKFQLLFDTIERDIEFLKMQDLSFCTEDIAKDFRWAIGVLKSKRMRINGKWSLLPGKNPLQRYFGAFLELRFNDIIGIDTLSFDPFAVNEPCIASGNFFGKKLVKVETDREYEAQSPVFMSFGIKSSAQCLEDHGLVPDTDDLSSFSCELTIDIDEDNDAFSGDKLRILEDNGIQSSITFDLYGDVEEISSLDSELLHFLRLKFISGKDSFILEPVFESTVWKTLESVFSRENEIAVIKYLLHYCERELNKINACSDEVSDREKVKQMNDQKRSSSAGLMAKLRLEERQVLQAHVRFLNTQLYHLEEGVADSLEFYQERRLKELDLLRPLDPSEVIKGN